MRLPAILLVAALASPSLPALAQAPPPPAPGAAAEKPAGISRDDYIKRAADRAAARFDNIDTDHDGILTRDEIRAYREAHHRVRHAPAAPPEPAPPPKQQ